ncbi:MAG TPA: hypothetical protein VNO35_08645 [Steroidobacteraceae bacterium]|nr:hypothetical protein [Steroidobacteraceae bacterium]
MQLNGPRIRVEIEIEVFDERTHALRVQLVDSMDVEFRQRHLHHTAQLLPIGDLNPSFLRNTGGCWINGPQYVHTALSLGSRCHVRLSSGRSMRHYNLLAAPRRTRIDT